MATPILICTGIGVTSTCERTIVCAAIGSSEDYQLWTSFLRSLVERGLNGA